MYTIFHFFTQTDKLWLFIYDVQRREATKIWAILQMVMDNFLGGGVHYFQHMESFLPYFDMLTNKVLI